MAEGGEESRLTWEDSEEIRQLMVLSMMGILDVEDLRGIADKNFHAKEYSKAASIYSMALDCPIGSLKDVNIVAEHLCRKRAECWFKMGRYLNAVEDSDTAIGFAKENNNINLIVKSLFIKIKAIERLGDYVQALPLILLFKHLKPDCKEITRTLTDVKEKLSEKIKKDERLVREVVITMLEFGTEEMERGNLTVALEHFSELLEFLHFKFLPGVLLKRAECLLQLDQT
ncbi:zinc finger CCCH domain-containing protein 7B-like [Montipora capricornis]|uniref:zinc finger CCCH domain-containing protein 7B-like n=1 Tax=Montipora capricornis TaxID=246305 RepID=UPI0035F0FD58